MAGELEILTGETWAAFVAEGDVVLTLGRTDCAPCKVFERELRSMLAKTSRWRDVRFGKILLDHRGFHHFKRERPWLREVTILPYTMVMRGGAQVDVLVGGGVDDLEEVMERALG